MNYGQQQDLQINCILEFDTNCSYVWIFFPRQEVLNLCIRKGLRELVKYLGFLS